MQFDLITPNQIRVGDILMCYHHDSQWERRSCRVVAIDLDNVPGTYTWASGWSIDYEYMVHLTCRHVNVKRLDAEGGPVYRWSLFPWNTVGRFLLTPKERKNYAKEDIP